MPHHAIIPFNHPWLERFGRIAERRDHLEVNFGANGVRIRFRGRACGVRLAASAGLWQVVWAARIDGSPEIPLFLRDNEAANYLIASDLEEGWHELELCRRTDPLGGPSQFFELIFPGGTEVEPPTPRTGPKLLFYGDSITAGGVVMAFGHEGEADGEFFLDNHRDTLTNAAQSFAGLTARTLDAQAEIVGIGGLAVLDNTGWWQGPEGCLGWQSTWDKVRPWMGDLEQWDFPTSAPDLIHVALGQNCLKDAPLGDPDHKNRWQAAYTNILSQLAAQYPKAQFLLGTTLMNHDSFWDDWIEELAEDFGPQAHTIRYQRNGAGTPGHLRVTESREMASELAPRINEILKSLG